MRAEGMCASDLFEHGLAFFEVEERPALLRVAQCGHDDFVEEPGRPLDDLQMAVVERVEGPGEETDLHEPVLLRCATVTSVPP